MNEHEEDKILAYTKSYTETHNQKLKDKLEHPNQRKFNVRHKYIFVRTLERKLEENHQIEDAPSRLAVTLCLQREMRCKTKLELQKGG